MIHETYETQEKQLKDLKKSIQETAKDANDKYEEIQEKEEQLNKQREELLKEYQQFQQEKAKFNKTTVSTKNKEKPQEHTINNKKYGRPQVQITKRVVICFTEHDIIFLKSEQRKHKFYTLSEYIRHKIFK